MIRQIRKQHNLSQQALARLLGISLRHEQYLETSERMPSQGVEMQLEYLTRRDCKVQILQKRDPDQGDEALSCDYCLASILVSQPALIIKKKSFCSILCAIRDELF